MKHLRLLLLLPSVLSAAILPDTIGAWKRGDPQPLAAPDPAVWEEYGLQDSERAPYADGAREFSISAWRFQDATGALAAFDHVRPGDAKPATLMGTSAANAKDTVVAAGNYLFVFNGYAIKPEELSHVVATVPRYAHSPLPTLPKYMPPGPEANSERYIVGPRSLARFAPSIPPSAAGFRFSAEAEAARFGTPKHETTLVVFSYPAMEMARDRLPEFQKIPGAMVKRSGPLVAIALNPASADEGERLLSQVKYQAEVTVPHRVPGLKDNPGNLFLNIFILCCVLAGFCIVSGLVVGGLRILFRRAGDSGEGDGMITLHLTGRQ